LGCEARGPHIFIYFIYFFIYLFATHCSKSEEEGRWVPTKKKPSVAGCVATTKKKGANSYSLRRRAAQEEAFFLVGTQLVRICPMEQPAVKKINKKINKIKKNVTVG
jgi:hypothetical protein